MAIDKVIGSLKVVVGADTRQATNAITSFRSTISTFASVTERSVGRVTSAFGGFASSGIFRDVKRSFDELSKLDEPQLDQLQKDAERLGMSFGTSVSGGIKRAAGEMQNLVDKVSALNENYNTFRLAIAAKIAPYAADYLEGLNALLSGAGRADPKEIGRAQTEQEKKEFRHKTAAARFAAARAADPYFDLSPGGKILALTRDAARHEQQTRQAEAAGSYTERSAKGADVRIRQALSPLLTTFGKNLTKVAAAEEPEELKKVARGLNHIIDANSREGFTALRANQRMSTNEKLEQQGEKQIEQLKVIGNGVNEMAQNLKIDQPISIPGKAG